MPLERCDRAEGFPGKNSMPTHQSKPQGVGSLIFCQQDMCVSESHTNSPLSFNFVSIPHDVTAVFPFFECKMH